MITIRISHRVLFAVVACIALAAALITGGPLQAQSTSRYFPETQHNVRGRFLQYWQDHGGLAQQGYPLSEEFQEASDLDGKLYTVQYFERAVFELHPENKPPYDVLLSQLGKFQLRARYPNNSNPATAPQQPPSGVPTAAPAPPTAAPPPPAPTAAPAPADDQAFVDFLAKTYNTIGGRPVTWSKTAYLLPDITNHLTGPVVYFNVDTDQARILIKQTSVADLTTWGKAVLHEIKTHWPNQHVSGLLSWVYYTATYEPSGGCHYADYDTNGEWYNNDTIVSMDYYTGGGGDLVTACGR